MANARGFGTGQGHEGMIPDPPLTPEDMINYLKKISDKYNVPETLQAVDFDLGANEAVRVVCTPARVNSLIVTVISGVVYVYLGDYSGMTGKAPAPPHISVSAGVVPTTQQFALPDSAEYVFTVQEGVAATAAGCIIPMAV